MFERYINVKGFTAFPESKDRYFISWTGIVRGLSGEDLPTSLDADGYPQVAAELWDGYRKYRVVDLMAICFKRIKIPSSMWNEVSGFNITGDKENNCANNVGYRFKSGPLECPNNSGFFYMPMFTRLSINVEGVIQSAAGKKWDYGWTITKPRAKGNITGGYYTATVVNDVGQKCGISRHRCLALAFLEYPDTVDKLVVNHIDGVPGNDWLDNLEWVTRGENNTHAYKTDLKSQHKRVLARHARTGKVTEYFSVSECGRQLGYSTGDAIAYRLNTDNIAKVWGGGYQLKYKDDTRDWIIPVDVEAAIKEGSKNCPVKVRDCKSLKVDMYSSITDASSAIGVGVSTIRWQLKNGLVVPHRGYQFKELDDDTPWADFTTEEIESRDKIAKTILGRNLLTGESCTFTSIRECYREHSSPPNLSVSIRNNEQRVYSSGWQYRTAGEDWREVENIKAEIAKYATEVMARNIITGEILIGESSRQLALAMGLDNKAVREAARLGPSKVYKVYQFRLGITNKKWPKIEDVDVCLLSKGTPPNGMYYRFTHVKTKEVKYFLCVEDCIEFLDKVNSKPVFFRLLKKDALFDGVWKVEKYRPSCLI